MFAKMAIVEGKENVVLLVCGAFSPPTVMHARIMEMGREYVSDKLGVHVAAGVLSPVHDAYSKEGLVSAGHRLAMLRAGCQDSSWLEPWDWECTRDRWTPTAQVMQELKRVTGCRVLLVAGSDILWSFNRKGLWSDDDLDWITKEGLVVIERDSVPCSDLILQHRCLFKNRWNMHVVPQYVKNDISSTRVRQLLQRGLSVKYLVHPSVEAYVNSHKLFS